MRRRAYPSALLALLLGLAVPGWAESLFKAETLADGTLYSDQVARRRGDLITILVRESTSISEKQQTQLKRENDVDAHLDLVAGMKETAASAGASAVGKLPALKFGGKKDFKGDGKYEATGDVKAAITGRVVDVLDNGNLVVEGRRELKVNQDTKTILVTGIVRTADITSGNQVLSEKMHNFQVAIAGEGPLSRSQQEGWLARLVDVLWPF